MHFGCCGSMIAPSTDPIGIEVIEAMAGVGFDYIELSLADIAALSEGSFAGLERRVNQSGIRCEACNNFFPRTIRLTGPEANPDRALDYARHALDRAGRLGAQIVVFGSSGAKNVPDGFSKDAAWIQIAELLQHLGPIAAQHGITIAIEPINRLESNIINNAAEGLRLMRAADHPNVQILIDYYHLEMEHEDHAIILEAGAAIRHLHFAQIEGRRFPSKPMPAYLSFFEWLKAGKYAGRCSIEAYTENFTAEARQALETLKSCAETLHEAAG